jgi:hypothetical protein
MSDHIQLVQDTLSSEAHLSINKRLIKILGLIPSILLADLLSKDRYFTDKGTKDDDGYFFTEQSYIKETLDLSEYHQKNATKKLVELGIIETKRVGIPPRIWFRISYHTVITNILNISDIKTKNLVYNNKNKYNKVSKDTKEVSPPTILEVPFLLEEWRTYKQIPKNQHHPKEGSKIHKKIAMLSTLLMKGKFNNHCDLDPKFLKQNNITNKALHRKYTKDELLAGMEEMAEMFKLNNQPEDKSKINKMSLDQLIYHPIAKISYLLKYLYTDAKGLEYKTIEVYDHWLEKLYEEGIFDRSIENDNHQFGILKKGLASIEDYFKWMYNNPMADVSSTVYSQIESEDKFYNTYITWLDDKHTNYRPYAIGTGGYNWYTFIKWLEEAIHGDHVHQYPTLDKRNYGK